MRFKISIEGDEGTGSGYAFYNADGGDEIHYEGFAVTADEHDAVVAERDALATEVERRKYNYPHMCRDGHEEIGWRGDSEMCPLDALTAQLAEVEGELEEAAGDLCGDCDSGHAYNLERHENNPESARWRHSEFRICRASALRERRWQREQRDR